MIGMRSVRSMADEIRDHVVVSWHDLAELLEMNGRPIKVWVEPDSDYVHVITEWDERDGPPPPEMKYIARGGYVESRYFRIVKTWNGNAWQITKGYAP